MNILMLPGDGIGPEIALATERALQALDRGYDLGLRLERADIGLASLARCGTTLSDEVFQRAMAADGIVLGPVSTAEYPPAERGGLNPSAEFRRRLDLFANIRPSRTRRGVPARAAAIDLVIVRENTEGFYADRTMVAGSGEFMPTPDLALAVRKVSRAGTERVVRVAVELALARRKHLTVVHKANALRLSDGLFLEAARAVAGPVAGLELDDQHVDAMAALLVRAPEDFDVIVTGNMFGDILSNEAAELAGGLGLAPSLNLGDRFAVAQASHGSAPEIAGQDRANPTALILSTAMLLAHLGRSRGRKPLVAAAAALERAVEEQLAEPGGTTPDLGGRLGTEDFAAALARRLRPRAT